MCVWWIWVRGGATFRTGASGAIVILSAIRYGKPLKPTEAFLRAHRDQFGRTPLAMLLVNLTARKPHKRHIENNVYLRKWVERHELRPNIAEGIAGKLDYPNYRWFDRMMIRLIMTLTKGPTDTTQTTEFTDWRQVNALVERIAALLETR